MLSQSRFDDTLKKAGLISKDPMASSVLTVEVRDPGGDLARWPINPCWSSEPGLSPWWPVWPWPAGANPRTSKRVSFWSPIATIAALRLSAPGNGCLNTISGIITEVDASEAFAPLRSVSKAFYALFGTLSVFVGLTLLASISLARVRQSGTRLRPFSLSRLAKGGPARSSWLITPCSGVPPL